MRWRLWITIVAAGVLLLLAAAWLAAPWWLAGLARDQLARQGFTVETIGIDHVGWHESRVGRLHLRQRQGGLELDLKGLTAVYTPAELLAGRLDSLAVGSLLLRLHPSPHQARESGLVLASPAALVAAIPVQHIRIDAMTIQRLDAGGEVLQALAGEAALADGVVGAELHEPGRANGLQASMKLDASGQLQARMQRGREQMLRIDTSIKQAGKALQVDGAMHVDLALLDGEAAQWVELPERRLQGGFDAQWQLSLPAGKKMNASMIQELIRAHASVALNADLAMPDAADNQSVRLQATLDYDRGQGRWRIADSSRLLLGGGRQPGVVTPASLAGSFALEDAGWAMTVDDAARLACEHLQLGGTLLESGGIGLQKPLRLLFRPGEPVQLEAPAALVVQRFALRADKNRLQGGNMQLAVDAGPLHSPVGSFDMQGVTLTTAAARLPASRLKGRFDLAHSPLTADGTLVSNDRHISVDWKLSHRPDQRRGELAYQLRPVRFGPGGIDLAKLIDTRDDYDLQAGSISGSGRLAWSDTGRGWQWLDRMSLKLAALQGFYKTNTFSGLNGTLPITLSASMLSLGATELHVDTVNAGVPISRLAMNAAVKYPFGGAAKVVVKGLQGEALGGQISSDRIDIDFARASNPFTVKLSHLDAKQIAEIRRQEGLYADGTLDGTLPFDWTPQGLKLKQGRLTARSPGGIIRYLGTESIRNMAATDRTTKMALDILSNLHYNRLVIGIDTKPDGETTLHIELKGHNPGYENGRPIAFNLNIEENVLKLLYSLRMADDISGRLERQVQKKLQQRQ